MENRLKKLTVSGGSLTLFISLLINFACKPNDPFVETPISGQTIIDTFEKEFVFDKPFKPKKQANKICFEYMTNLKADSISEPPKFPDGTSLKLTVSVFDQKGRKYEFNHIANSVEHYLCVSPLLTDEWVNISKKEVVFIKLLVTSNPKINVSKIEWVSFNSWDL